MLAAERGGIMMLAEIAMKRADHHGIEPERPVRRQRASSRFHAAWAINGLDCARRVRDRMIIIRIETDAIEEIAITHREKH